MALLLFVEQELLDDELFVNTPDLVIDDGYLLKVSGVELQLIRAQFRQLLDGLDLTLQAVLQDVGLDAVHRLHLAAWRGLLAMIWRRREVLHESVLVGNVGIVEVGRPVAACLLIEVEWWRQLGRLRVGRVADEGLLRWFRPLSVVERLLQVCVALVSCS